MGLVEVLGSGYVIEHCVSAFKKIQHKKLYEVYVTDMLLMQAQGIAKLCQVKKIDYPRFAELIDKSKKQDTEKEVVDDRSCKEIVSSLWGRMKIGKKR